MLFYSLQVVVTPQRVFFLGHLPQPPDTPANQFLTKRGAGFGAWEGAAWDNQNALRAKWQVEVVLILLKRLASVPEDQTAVARRVNPDTRFFEGYTPHTKHFIGNRFFGMERQNECSYGKPEEKRGGLPRA